MVRTAPDRVRMLPPTTLAVGLVGLPCSTQERLKHAEARIL